MRQVFSGLNFPNNRVKIGRMQPPSSHPSAIHKSRTGLIASGILYFCTGLLAIIFPRLVSIAIVQIISLLLIITGIASLYAAVFGKHAAHRMIHGTLALCRIILGILMLKKILVGLAVFTLIIAAFFLIEGVLGMIAATQLKWHRCWLWLLLNSIIAIALGVIILTEYPITASWIIGILYGVNAVIAGIALLLLGCSGIPLPDTSKTAQ